MDKQLRQDAAMEDALRAEPLAQMPRSITGTVMSRIQTNQRPTLLTGSDFVLSAVIASCLGAFWFAALNLPPILIAKLRIQSILLYQDFLVNSRWLVPTLFFGAAAFLAALTIPTLIKMTIDHRR